AEVGPVNGGISIRDRFDQLLFAVSWLNAEHEPLWLRPGERAVSRFRLRADLEPGEYSVALGVSEALRDDKGRPGWDQNIGGARLAYLPRAAKIAVLPRHDNRRRSFRPA